MSPLPWSCLLLLALESLVGDPARSQSEAQGGYSVKAAFLYHFANFLVWPASTFQTTNNRLWLCILGKDPFGHTLEKTLEKKTLRDHAFDIHRNPSRMDLQHCHMLYLASAESPQMETLHHHIAKRDVLTVGEDLEFMRLGGMVRFFVQDQKVQFPINPDVTHQTKLKVSSKLLRLAKIVSRYSICHF